MPLQYTLTPIEKDPVGDPSPPVGKVIFTIFAGRKRYLECLTQYLDILLDRGLITEVHLWNYTRSPIDSIYLNKLAKRRGYVHKKPFVRMSKWDAYYAYYVEAQYNDDDILIKCDDDVVYIDVDAFAQYLNEVRDGGLYYPNIVNNEACAYVQMKYRVHHLISDSDIMGNYNVPVVPITGWHQRHDRAVAIHEEFLANPDTFKINALPFSWKGRISINMFAGRFSTIKIYYAAYLKHKGGDDDEGFLTVSLFNYVAGHSYIVPFFRAVHFAFGTQGVPALDATFLAKYRGLANDTRKMTAT